MKISIVTANYNRFDLLKRLYKSILENSKSYANIEWLIMDDGSKDNIDSLIDEFKKEASFDIFCYKQSNMGKMQAINNLIPKTTGDIIIEMDNDDYFMDDIFNVIVDDYKDIKDNDSIYGIIYEKKITSHNKSIDKRLDKQEKRLFDLHFKYDYDFDMAITFKSAIRKKFKYKLINNEKFVTEASMYYKMDNITKGLYIRTIPIMICNYQEDGYTNQIKKLFMNNPYGYYEYFKNILSYDTRGILFKKRLYIIKHFILFTYLSKKSFKESKSYVKGFNKLLYVILYLPGIIASKRRFYEKEDID